MGVISFLDGSEVEQKYVRVIKNCFLGKIKPGDYSGLLDPTYYNPLLKRRAGFEGKLPKYDLALITVRFGVQIDAANALKLFTILSKQNNIPTIVLVTHAEEENVEWDAIKSIDSASVFYVENYLPKERLESAKSKRLILPLLEAIKKVERSDVRWCNPEEGFGEAVQAKKDEFCRYTRRVMPNMRTLLCIAVVVALVSFFVGLFLNM